MYKIRHSVGNFRDAGFRLRVPLVLPRVGIRNRRRIRRSTADRSLGESAKLGGVRCSIEPIVLFSLYVSECFVLEGGS
jgi:hypothetical protein